jgi:aminoglycoside phosphotransferase (APT) family kinase protein
MTTGVLTSSDYDRLLAVFAAHKPLFDQVTVPHLVHWDYHFENILQQDGHISGILDFEWALCGDPTLDLRQERQWEETCPGSRDFVYAGYTAHRALAPDHALRVKLYTMLQNLDWAVDQGFAGDTQIEGKAQLLAALASF